MVFDKVGGFEILKQYGICVTRSAYVKSVEDAVTFASMGVCDNGKKLPILLRDVLGNGHASAITSSLGDVASIRDGYALLAEKIIVSRGCMLAQVAAASGTDIAIEGCFDPDIGKVITLRRADKQVWRMVPFGDVGAASLISEFRSYHHDRVTVRVRNILKNLLLRASRFFDESKVERFELHPVRLHANSYTILDARLIMPKDTCSWSRLGRYSRERGYCERKSIALPLPTWI